MASASDPARDPGEDLPSSRSRLWLVLVAITALVVGLAALVLIFVRDDDATPGTVLDLAAVVADEREIEGQLHLRLADATAANNDYEIEVAADSGSWLQEIDTILISFFPYSSEGEASQATISLSGDPARGSGDVSLAGSPFWEVRVDSTVGAENRRLASFVVLVPDPNLHGDSSVAMAASELEAEALYQRASTTVSALHRVSYEQQLSDGDGLGVLSFHAVNDGADGSTPGFTYHTPGGLEATVSGTTAWTRYPNEDWEVRETNAMIPPSEWGGEYTGATGFQLGPISETRQGPCRIVTFVVPGSANQSIAWYAWCVEERTGRLLRDAMISRSHYMITDFANFDGSVVIEPPEEAGSPVPSATS